MTLTVTPGEAYVVGSLNVINATVGRVTATKVNNATYTFTMPEGDVTVITAFNRAYKITIEPSEGGTVTASSQQAPGGPSVEQATVASPIYLRVTPEEGYELDTLTAYKDDGTEANIL